MTLCGVAVLYKMLGMLCTVEPVLPTGTALFSDPRHFETLVIGTLEFLVKAEVLEAGA